MKYKRILFVMDSMTLLILKQKLILILLTFALMPSSGLINVSCNIIQNNDIKFHQSSDEMNNEFKPIKPKLITDKNLKLNNFFNKNDNYKIFIPKSIMENNNINYINSKSTNHDRNNQLENNILNKPINKKMSIETLMDKNMKLKKNIKTTYINNNYNELFTLDPLQNLTISNEGLKLLQKFLLAYVQNTISQSSIELLSSGGSGRTANNDNTDIERRRSLGGVSTDLNQESFDIFEKELYQFIDENIISVNVPRAMETGRLFLFKGLKKLLWPLFIGVQIAKSILLALFLPSILGSLGKMVGKGLTQISGFNHPSETVADLEFKDTVYSLDDDYSYPRPEASDNHFHTQAYQGATDNLQNGGNTLSRFGYGDQKLTYINNGQIASKQNKLDINTKSNLLNENKNVFKDFLKVPASSLLLSNYDPFYSPLLSRIDSVFSQLGLVNNNEDCRSKLICLMYSNPAKYAPYSNLVSAQLSRELNELRKPTTDNEEILRFFKYMHAAKDGQDGVNCDKSYETCTDLKDSETPVMITTFNDINKLVQARKFVGK